ncbi:hypothetical protein ASPCAL14580 [Aspergillus calidoustus]|uniref:Uncharacterized protein n=1 Tax=Aspergillus calidoustus TaxID=454130 RepID=A0A0U5GI36_ASPCI|nr:hypothetical protein ASPCAL14580 [Aspergillus calidoustus]
MIQSRDHPVIMDNPARFTGLSLAAVRLHFEAYTKECQARGERDGISRRACLVVDDEVLQILAGAVAQSSAEVEVAHVVNRRACWVKTVEAWPDLDETHDDYDGSMKCSVSALWRLWQWASDPDPIAILMRDENGVYIG